MEIIDYGYKVPELEDTDFWDSLVFDIRRLSTHNHDGVNSSFIAPGAVDVYEFEFETADWVSNSPDPGYHLDFTFPITWNFTWTDQAPCPVQLVVREDATNEPVFLTSQRQAANIIRFQTSAPFDGNIGVY